MCALYLACTHKNGSSLTCFRARDTHIYTTRHDTHTHTHDTAHTHIQHDIRRLWMCLFVSSGQRAAYLYQPEDQRGQHAHPRGQGLRLPHVPIYTHRHTHRHGGQQALSLPLPPSPSSLPFLSPPLPSSSISYLDASRCSITFFPPYVVRSYRALMSRSVAPDY